MDLNDRATNYPYQIATMTSAAPVVHQYKNPCSQVSVFLAGSCCNQLHPTNFTQGSFDRPATELQSVDSRAMDSLLTY